MAEEDFSRPYIGYRSAGRRPESQQDRVASANAPLSALRGYIAGTLGLPGDIEGLGRMLIPGVSNESYIPGSEYFRNVLPMQGLQNTPTGGAFTELGGLAGGAGLMTAAKAGKTGARFAGEQLNRAILDSSGPLAKLVPEAAKPMYAVKPKGGNWSPAYGAKDVVEESIQPMKRDAFIDVPELQDPKNAAMNKWLDTKLQKYIRNDMGTPDDPIRLAHEEGYSHFPGNLAEDYGSWLPEDTASMRRKAGYPEEGFAVQKHIDAGYPEATEASTRKAELWENLADSEIKSRPAAAYQKQLGSLEDRILKEQADKNPWIKKLDPETPIYTLSIPSEINSTLGFGHMTDELRNMLDSTSGLPANLRLTPEQLDKVTVKQMIEKVDAVNKWRAAEAAKAEKAGMLDNLTATPRLQDPTTQLSFVEKPGMTWIDIPETTDEAARKYCTTIGRQAGWCTQGNDLAKSYGSGTNRLTTMLDAEGRPHVQAMLSSVAKTDEIMDDIDDIMNYMSKVEQRKFNKFLGSDDFYGETDEALEWLQSNIPKAYERYVASLSGPSNITEIKPVGNDFSSERALEYAKRDPEYRAKITDSVLKFLNTGEWGTVKQYELDLFDIVDLRDPSTVKKLLKDVLRYKSPKDREKTFNEALELNPETPKFMTSRQFMEFVGSDYAGLFDGYAKGGSVSVYDPTRIDEIINGIDEPQGYAEGGSVSALEEDTKAAFGIYPKQRAKPSSKETKAAAAEAAQFAAEMLIPQSAFDAGLMLIPGGKVARKAGAALIALDAGDAKAGGLSSLMKLLSKEAPAQAKSIREALGRAYTKDVEHSVVGSSDRGPAGSIMSGDWDSVQPNQLDIQRALKSDKSIVDFHTHPQGGQAAFDIAPSESDFRFYSNEYFPGAKGRELRTIIASPAANRTPTSYSFFATDNPSNVFDRRTMNNAVYELQRAGPKGIFKSVMDDPRFREYFDAGGTMGELAGNIAPLSLLDLRKAQNLGRGELKLSGKPLSQNRDSSNIELFNMMNPQAVEFLKSKKFAEGGEVNAPDMEFKEDPEALRLYKYAMKQAMPNREDTMSSTGAGARARVAGGDFSAGIDMNRMTQGQQDQLMKSLAANYNINLGDLNLNARMEKPLDAKDVYVGMLNGSIPLGVGRAMLGVQGVKTPYGSDVLGYNVGYSGKVGPGLLSTNVNIPKQGKASGQVRYQIPFAEGGSVSVYDSGRVDAIANQFM